MGANLMGRSVVDAQGERAAADIKAKRLPREGLLKDALAKITGEEEAIAAPRSQGGEEPCLSHAKILRLIDHCKIVRPSATLGVRWSPETGQFAKLAAKEDEDEQRGWQTEELQRGLQGEGGA